MVGEFSRATLAIPLATTSSLRARPGTVQWLLAPIAGIPRILRSRKKFGTVRGFSVVDPGGNWLRISKLGDSEADDAGGKTKV